MFENTLVCKARDVGLDLCTKPVSFITHLLKVSGVKMNDFGSFNISQRDLENFCHGLKANLVEQYVGFWKDQVQQHENQGKLRKFKKFKTNLNFEEYLNVILNIVKLLKNSEYLLTDCLLNLVAITIFLLMKELVSIAT